MVPNTWRRVQRGGGADVRDDLAKIQEAENCSELCNFGMMWGGLGYSWYQVPVPNGNYDPYYLKCMEGSAAGPLNGLRLQHASQFNTFDLDPAVPQMNVTDTKACLGMLLEYFNVNQYEIY